MLLYPLKEEFYLPTMLVKVSYGLSWNMEIIGQIDIISVCFSVKVFNTS